MWTTRCLLAKHARERSRCNTYELGEAIKESTKTPKKVRFHSCSLELLLQHLERIQAEKTDYQLHYQFSLHSQRSFYTCRRETGVTREKPTGRASRRKELQGQTQRAFFRTDQSHTRVNVYTKEYPTHLFSAKLPSGRTNRVHWRPFVSHCFLVNAQHRLAGARATQEPCQLHSRKHILSTKVWGMGNPRYEVIKSEKTIWGEDVSPFIATSNSVFQLEAIKRFCRIYKETMVYSVWMIVLFVGDDLFNEESETPKVLPPFERCFDKQLRDHHRWPLVCSQKPLFLMLP